MIMGCHTKPRLTIVDDKNQQARQLKDTPLLAFAAQGEPLNGQADRNVYAVSFDDATRNILVLGGTGRGKTESIMLPAASQLIEQGANGLILDVKGDFTELSTQWPKRTRVLGPNSTHKVNLINGINSSVLRAILDSARMQFMSSELYWGSTGVEDTILIFLAYREFDLNPTLASLHDGLINPDRFCVQLERELRSRQTISDELARQIETRCSDEFGILRIGGFHGNETESSRAGEQYAWQTNALIKILSPFSMNHAIREAFCNQVNDPDNNHYLDLRKTLILDLPIGSYPDVAYLVGRILRLRFMEAVVQDYVDHKKHKHTFLLIDEYQQYINTDKAGSSNMLRDDNLWLDRSRSYRHINVLATQSLTSMLSQGSEMAVMAIVQNCQTTIVLPSTDNLTISRVAELVGDRATADETVSKLRSPDRLGQGFIHIANHGQSHGGTLCGLICAGSLTSPEFQFMNRHINRQRHRPVGSISMRATPTLVDNNYCRQPKKISAPSGRLHVLMERGSHQRKLWLQAITNHPAVTYVSIFDPSRNHSTWGVIEVMNPYFEDLSPGDILLIPFPTDRKTGELLGSSYSIGLIHNAIEDGVTVAYSQAEEQIRETERTATLMATDHEAMIHKVHEVLSKASSKMECDEEV